MRKNRRQRGQITIVLVAASILFIFAFCALVVDLSRQLMNRGKLRNYSDASASAGANLLPNSGNCGAVLAATRIYAFNLQANAPQACPQPAITSTGPTFNFTIGSDSVAVTTPYTDPVAPDPTLAPNLIRVVARRTVRNHFGQLMGLTQSTQAASAVARKGGSKEAQVIFSKSQSQALTINGNNMNIIGMAHSNQRFTFVGNNTTIDNVTYVTTATITGNGNSIPTDDVSVQPLPILPTSLSQYRSQAVAAGTHFTESVRLEMDVSGGIRVRGIGSSSLNRVIPNGSVLYVEGGTISITENQFRRTITMIATGGVSAIAISSNQANILPADGRVIAHSDNTITVTGNGYNLTGILDAGGALSLSANVGLGIEAARLIGTLWGNSVIVNGNNLTILRDPNILSGTSGVGSSLIQ